MWNTGVYPTVNTLGLFITTICAVNSLTTVGGLSSLPNTSPLAMSFLLIPLTENPTLSPGSACWICSWCISIVLTSPFTPFPSLAGTIITLSPSFITPVSTLPTGTTPIPVMLYTSCNGSLNGNVVGFNGISNLSICSITVGPVYHAILSDFFTIFSPRYAAVGMNSTLSNLNPTPFSNVPSSVLTFSNLS